MAVLQIVTAIAGLTDNFSTIIFYLHVFNHFNKCLKEAKTGKLSSVY